MVANVLESSTGTSVNPYRYVGQWGYYNDGAMGSTSELLYSNTYYAPTSGRTYTVPYLVRFFAAAALEGVSIPMEPSAIGGVQRDCAELLRDAARKVPRGLLDCLLAAGPDKNAQKCCIERFKGDLSDAVIGYLACIGAALTAGGLHETRDRGRWFDPCRPPNDEFCQECCYEKFLVCLMKCARKPGSIFSICVSGCERGPNGFQKCLLQCP
jgi:hypothetical protein